MLAYGPRNTEPAVQPRPLRGVLVGGVRRLKGQLDATGLFRVNLQSTEWVTYTSERVKDAYPVYQLGWFPDFPDADNYLTPFFTPDNFIANHFENPAITKLITEEATEPDPGRRRADHPDPGCDGQRLHLDSSAAHR